MKKRQGVKKPLALLLALLMLAQTGIMTAADDDSDTEVENTDVSETESGSEPQGDDTTEGGETDTTDETDTDDSTRISVGVYATNLNSIELAESMFDGEEKTSVIMEENDGYVEVKVENEKSVQLTGVKIIPANESGSDLVVLREWTHGFGNEDADNLFDFNESTKWCHSSPYSYVIWEVPEAVSISGYEIVTAEDSAECTGRNPESWTLYGSNDYDSLTGTCRWETIDDVENDTVLQDENTQAYDFYLGADIPAYKYYMWEIYEIEDADVFQVSGFNLLTEDGVVDYSVREVTENETEWANMLTGVKIQGSSDGKEWITLYRINEEVETPDAYEITEAMLGSAASEYTFSYFRVIDDSSTFAIAEVEFYGEENAALDPFPTQEDLEESGEPIYSYVGARRVLDFIIGDNDRNFVYDNSRSGGVTADYLWDIVDDPVVIIGGAFPSNAAFSPAEEIDGHEVIGVAPCAFKREEDIRTVELENKMMFIGDAAFSENAYLETVSYGPEIRDIDYQAFAWSDNIQEHILAEEVTDAEYREGNYPVVENGYVSISGVLIDYANSEQVGTLTLPEYIKVLEYQAFNNAYITTLDAPFVTDVCFEAFFDSKIEHIIFSDNLEYIANQAFYFCDNLKTLTVPSVVDVDCVHLDEENGWYADADIFRTWDEDAEKEVIDTAQELTIHTYANNELDIYVHYRQVENDLGNVTVAYVGRPTDDVTAGGFHGKLVEQSMSSKEAMAMFDDDIFTYVDADGDPYVVFESDEFVQFTGAKIVPRTENGLTDIIVHESSGEFSEGESAEMLFDYDDETKWCFPWDEENSAYVVFEISEAVAVTGYEIVTGNDTEEIPERNPDSWILWGSEDGEDWEEIDTVTDDTGLPAANYAPVSYEVSTTEAYRFYKWEILANGGDEACQVSAFNLITADGTVDNRGTITNDEREWGHSLQGVKIQGSSDGEEWITLYRVNEAPAAAREYWISEDMLGSAASEYAYKYFRVIDDADWFAIAEIEFYGETAGEDAVPFPTEINEPIYSYVEADQIFGWNDLGDGEYIEEKISQYDNPVIIIGAALPEDATIAVDKIDDHVVVGFAPYAFENETDLDTLYLDGSIAYVYTRAFGDCENLNKVVAGSNLRTIEWDTFAWVNNCTEIVMAEGDEGNDRAFVADGCLVVDGRCVLYAQTGSVGELELDSRITELGTQVFSERDIGSIIAPNVKFIDYEAFAHSKAARIELGEDVEFIADNVFGWCDNLTELIIPSYNIDLECVDEENGEYIWREDHSPFRMWSEEDDADIIDTASELTVTVYDNTEFAFYLKAAKNAGYLGDVNVVYLNRYFGSAPQDGNEDVSYDKAFDGDINTHFDAWDGGSDGYVGITFDNPVKLTEVHLTPAADGMYPGITVLDSTGGFGAWFGGEIPEKLFDYSYDTKWCTGVTKNAYVVFSLPEAASIYGYQMVTGNDNEDYHGRNPESWTLYGASDYDTENGEAEWTEIHHVEEAGLEDKNNQMYTFYADGESYQYYKLVIHENAGADRLQLTDFNLLYNGCYTYEDCESIQRKLNTLNGTKVQGSVDGENWVTLFRYPDRGAVAMATYVIGEDLLSNLAHEYTFTQFRLINDTNFDLNIAELRFFGEEDEDLDPFPTVDEITEPILSVVEYNEIMDWGVYNFEDNAFLWDDDNDETPSVSDFYDYDNYDEQIPVMVIDAVFPSENAVDDEGNQYFDGELVIPDTMEVDGTVRPVLGIAPYAFRGDRTVETLVLGENTRYICEAAFRNSEKITEVVLNKHIREIAADAFLDSWIFELFSAGYEDSLSDEDKELQHGRFIEVSDDGYIYRDDVLLLYPDARTGDSGSFEVPDSIRVLGTHAFYNSDLTSIDLNNIEEIGWGAFAYSSIEEFDIPESVCYVGGCAFLGTGIEEIILPARTDRICLNAFNECENLKKVTILSTSTDFNEYTNENPYHDIFDMADDGLSVPTVYVFEGSVAEQVAVMSDWRVELLETEAPIYNTYEAEDGLHLESIIHCGHSEFEIPYGVNIIDSEVCALVGDNQITSITFPETLYQIRGGAFAGKCADGVEITWGGAVPVEIHDGAFDFDIDGQYEGEVLLGSILYLFDRETKTAAVNGYWFDAIDANGCLTIPDSITIEEESYTVIAVMNQGITEHAAWERARYRLQANGLSTDADGYGEDDYARLISLIIPDSVIFIGNDAVAGHEWLTSVTLPKNLNHLGDNAFRDNFALANYSGLTAYDAEDHTHRYQLHNGMIIDTYADHMVVTYAVGKNEATITIPEGVKRLKWDAFRNDDDIVTVNLPSTLNGFGEHPFAGCDNITDFVFPNGNDTFTINEDDGSILSENGRRLVAYPYGRIPKVTDENNEEGVIQFSDGIEVISVGVIRESEAVNDIHVPASVKYIDDWAFNSNPNLWRVMIYGTLEGNLNIDAFADNQNLSCLDYFGDSLSLYWYRDDYFAIRYATYADGGYRYDEEGRPVPGEKVILSIVEEDCGIEMFSLRDGSSWDDPEAFEEYSIDENPWFTKVVGEEAVYRITYDANGGIYAPVTQHRREGEEVVITTEKPIDNNGREFLGWTDDPESAKINYTGGEKYSSDTNITLYAVWGDAQVRYDTKRDEYGNLCLIYVEDYGNTHFVIPEGVNIIHSGAFRDVNTIDSVTFPTTLIEIHGGAFRGKSEFEVTWKSTYPIHNIADVFDNYNEEGDARAQYNGMAFVNNLLVQYNTESKLASVFSYWNGAIDGDGAVEVPAYVTIDNVTYTVDSIYEGAFNYSSLMDRTVRYLDDQNILKDYDEDRIIDTVAIKQIILPDTVKTIGYDAFSGNEDLVYLKLPAGLVYFEKNMVLGCTNLPGIEGLDEFGTATENRYTICNNAVLDTYVEGVGLKLCPEGYPNETFTVPDGVEVILEEAFNNCDLITEVEIPAGVKDIRFSAFYGCDNIITYEIAGDNEVFTLSTQGGILRDGSVLIAYPYGTYTGGTLTLGDDGDNITTISGAFRGFTELTGLVIPASVTQIDGWSVCDNPNLTSVTISGEIERMNINAFAYNDRLEQIVYHGESIELFQYEWDSLAIRVAKNIFGESMYDGEGRDYYGEKTLFVYTNNEFTYDFKVLGEEDEDVTAEGYVNPYVDFVHADDVDDIVDVTYHAGDDMLGVTFVPPVQHKLPGQTLTLTSQYPEINGGGEFLGWATVPNGEVVYPADAANTYTGSTALDLYPIWDEESLDLYTLIIDAKGGTCDANGLLDGEAQAVMNKMYGWRVACIEVQKEGYRFLGLSLNENASTVDYSIHDIIWYKDAWEEAFGDEITLYAVWQENPAYKVNYNLNGADGGVAQQNASDGETVTLSDASRDGYKLVGWAYTSDSEEADFKAGDAFTYSAPVVDVDFSDESILFLDNAEIISDELRMNGEGEGTNMTSSAQVNGTFQQTDWTDGMTVSLWVRADESDTLKGTVPLYSINIGGEGYIAVTASLDSAINTARGANEFGITPRISNEPKYPDGSHALTPGEWTHIAAVYREDGVYIYRDGVLFSSQTYSFVDPDTGATVEGSYADLAEQLHETIIFELGSWSSSDWNMGDFQGLIDDVMIYNRDLTADEVKFIAEGKYFVDYSEGTNTNSITLYAVWEEVEVPEDAVKIVIGDVSGRPGDTVEVEVSLENNPGIAALSADIAYPAEALKLDAVAIGDAFEGESLTTNIDKNPAAIGWINTDENVEADDVIFKLTFTILENAAEGEYAITVSDVQVYKLDETEVASTIENGSVTVYTFVPGDVNSDGYVDLLDLVRLNKYLGGYVVEINADAADVTGDGKVNIVDLLRLSRYFAGYNVELESSK